MEFYQSAKFKAVVIVPKITATLSITGSSLIVRDVLLRKENRRRRLKITTTLIVTFMSILDVIYSIVVHFLGTWMIPRETGVWGAAGNQGTCTFQGFISSFLAGATTALNTTLAVTYVLVVRFGWKDDRLRKPHMSFVLLGVPVLASIGFTIWPLMDQALNWDGGYACHITAAPLGCSESGVPYPCERGTPAKIREMRLAGSIWVMVCFAIIVISTLNLYCTVLQKERATDRYAVNESQRNRRHSKRVAMQGIWYAGSFFLTYISYCIIIILQFGNKPIQYWLLIMHAICGPLQGFWNAVVYFRTRFINKNKRNGHNVGSSLRQSSLARRAIGVFHSVKVSKKMSSDTPGISATTMTSRRKSDEASLAGAANSEEEMFNDEEGMLEEEVDPIPREQP